METMTRTGERMETAGIPVKQVQPGTARMRDLTPAQRRAVLFAQQQVLRVRAAKKAKDERQAEGGKLRTAELHRGITGCKHRADAAARRRLSGFDRRIAICGAGCRVHMHIVVSCA